MFRMFLGLILCVSFVNYAEATHDNRVQSVRVVQRNVRQGFFQRLRNTRRTVQTVRVVEQVRVQPVRVVRVQQVQQVYVAPTPLKVIQQVQTYTVPTVTIQQSSSSCQQLFILR